MTAAEWVLGVLGVIFAGGVLLWGVGDGRTPWRRPGVGQAIAVAAFVAAVVAGAVLSLLD